MATLGELLKQGRHEELWQRCCGFIDLSLEDFMKIQERLLLEQLELLKKCELGRYIMNGTDPNTLEEFRTQVPLTTYADYAPYLLKRRKNVLPEKPLVWLRTSGRSGEYPAKWVPLTERQYETIGGIFLAVLLLGSCSRRGEVTLKEHDKYLYALAPSPYISGISGRRVDDEGILDFLPPLDEAEKMEDNEDIIAKLDSAKDSLDEARSNVEKAEDSYEEVVLPGTPLIKFAEGNNYMRTARTNLLSAHSDLNQAYRMMVRGE